MVVGLAGCGQVSWSRVHILDRTPWAGAWGWETCLHILSRSMVHFSLLKIPTESWLSLLLFTAGVPHLQAWSLLRLVFGALHTHRKHGSGLTFSYFSLLIFV